MKKFLLLLLFTVTFATFSVNAGDAVKTPLLSASEDEVVKFIVAFPEFLKENNELNPTDPGSVAAVMTTIATDKAKWEAFAKAKGFTSYDSFIKVSAAVTTAFAYQLLLHNAEQLEKQITSMPAAVQGIAKKKLKPVREQISQYSKMITPETLEVVNNHMDELQKILIPTEKIKSKKK
jgi:hypothetical protein